MKKQGIQLALNTIVLIALGVLILTVLIILFVTQAGFFRDNVFERQGKTNVDAVVVSCNSLVDSEQVYGYCCEKRNVKTSENEFDLTCDELRGMDFVGGRVEAMGCGEVVC